MGNFGSFILLTLFSIWCHSSNEDLGFSSGRVLSLPARVFFLLPFTFGGVRMSGSTFRISCFSFIHCPIAHLCWQGHLSRPFSIPSCVADVCLGVQSQPPHAIVITPPCSTHGWFRNQDEAAQHTAFLGSFISGSSRSSLGLGTRRLLHAPHL